MRNNSVIGNESDDSNDNDNNTDKSKNNHPALIPNDYEQYNHCSSQTMRLWND